MSPVLSAEKIREALKQNPPLIEGLLDEQVQIQPNGVDLSLQSVQGFRDGGRLDFDGSERMLPTLSPIPFNEDWVQLHRGEYLITFNEIVNLPLDLMALGRPRSSLLRMAATIGTAVWDAGYHGRSQSLLVVYNPNGITLKRNARLLQLVFFSVDEGTHAYHGIYQNENILIPGEKERK